MVQLTANTEGPNIDDGTYKLRIGSSELRHIKDYDNPDELIPKIEIWFTIVGDEDWDGAQFCDLFSPMTSKRSKLGQLARAAFKSEELPKEWDTDDLDGLFVSATVKLKDSGYNSIVNDTIKPVKPKSAQAGKPASKATKPAVDEDDEDTTWQDEESDEDAA